MSYAGDRYATNGRSSRERYEPRHDRDRDRERDRYEAPRRSRDRHDYRRDEPPADRHRYDEYRDRPSRDDRYDRYEPPPPRDRDYRDPRGDRRPSYDSPRNTYRGDHNERGQNRHVPKRPRSPSLSRTPPPREPFHSKFASGWDVQPNPDNPPLQALIPMPGSVTLSQATGLRTSPNKGDPSAPSTGGIESNNATRPARRLYVGNLPPTVAEQSLRVTWKRAMEQYYPDLVPDAATLSADELLLNVYLNRDKKYAFVECRTMEEAAAGLLLDQLPFDGHSMKIKRPTDYVESMWPKVDVPPPKNGGPMAVAAEEKRRQAMQRSVNPADETPPAKPSNMVPDGPNKVFAGGLPYNLGEQEIIELFSTYGPLRSFHLIRDKERNTSKGYAFFEYFYPEVTDKAVAGLNGIQIGDKTLNLRRAALRDQRGAPATAASLINPQLNVAAILNPGAAQALLTPTANKPATRIVILSNMVEPDELRDDQEYKEIFDDIKEECGSYGLLLKLVLPRPGEPGVGRAFLEYNTVTEAQNAFQQVNGRVFGAKTVVADYLDETSYARRQFD